MAGLLFVFLDGVGLGSGEPAVNPLAQRWQGLRALAGGDWTEGSWPTGSRGGVVSAALDTSLGVAGLPQSATGQTTLLTGRNAALSMGRHYGPWPGPTLLALLHAGNLFMDGVSSGGALLANAYPPAYFQALERAANGEAARSNSPTRRARASAPVSAARAAGLALADLAAYGAGRAVAADLDGSGFAPSPAHAPRFDARAQAEVLAALAGEHAFTFFDVWAGDRAGHAQDRSAASRFLTRLDTFLPALVGALPSEVTLLITSDHGNLEDMSAPRHTRANVPLLALGPHAEAFIDARSLLDVAPAARAVLARD